jgi:hypothetical protein
MRFLSLALVSLPLLAQPIQLHPSNPNYFEFRGQPTVLITSAEHYGMVVNPDLDYIRYLDTLAKDGLNYTRLVTGSYVEVPGAFGIKRNTLAPDGAKFLAPFARSATPGYSGGGNKFDLTQFNPAYFERLKGFLTEAGKRGIVVEITLFSSTYNEPNWKISPFHPGNNVNGTPAIDYAKLCTLSNGSTIAHQERMVRRIVRELNAFDNIFYEIQNEPWSDQTVLSGFVNAYLKEPVLSKYPNSIDLASPDSLAWQSRVAYWITSEEAKLPQKHLIAQNICNFKYPAKDYADGVSILNFHYAYPEAAIWNRGSRRAIGYDETGFITANDDDAFRAEAWNFLFAGGALFNNLDYSFTLGKEDGTDLDPNGPGWGSPTLRKQLGTLAGFMKSLPLVDLEPDSRFVRHSPGLRPQAISAGGKVFAAYFRGDGGSTVEIDLPSGSWLAQWIDPKTGVELAVEGFKNTARGKHLKSPASRYDLVLKVTPASRQ